MTDQNTFMETVQNVTEIVRTSEAPMSEQEILAYFADMDLDENQKRLIMEYILTAEQREQEEQTETQTELDDESEEEKESKVFQMYLDEVAMLPSVTAKARLGMYEKLLQGDSKMIETISTAWLKKVLTLAEKYADEKLAIEDLVQEGNMALFLKLQELLGTGGDSDIEDKLSEAVEEGIMSYASMMNGDKELENSLVGKVSLIHEAKKMLATEKGQEPTIEELAEYTRMSVDELKDLEEVMKEL